MSYKTNVLKSIPVVERFIADETMEKTRLESKLGANTVSEYKNSKSVEENDKDRAEWQSGFSKAATDVQNATTPKEVERFEIIREEFKLKLRKQIFEDDDDNSDPENIVKAAANLKRTQVLLNVQLEFITELNQTLTKLKNPTQ